MHVGYLSKHDMNYYYYYYIRGLKQSLFASEDIAKGRNRRDNLVQTI